MRGAPARVLTDALIFACLVTRQPSLVVAAHAKDRGSGRSMELFTNAPGVQLYTANWINNLLGKQGVCKYIPVYLCVLSSTSLCCIHSHMHAVIYFYCSAAAVYNKYQGFCLETQHFPDSVNQPTFPSTILRRGETYDHIMVHKFSTF